jgi:hypothetical protein
MNRQEAVERVMSVLIQDGIPVFEWGHETTPTEPEVRGLAEEIVSAILPDEEDHPKTIKRMLGRKVVEQPWPK